MGVARKRRNQKKMKGAKKLFANKSNTFPKKAHDKGTRRYDLHKQAKATLGSGNLKAAVQLPDSEDQNEWLAVNTVDFFNQINLLYGSIGEFCTEETCPTMSAGTRYEYYWRMERGLRSRSSAAHPIMSAI